jgi:hypothetical protein
MHTDCLTTVFFRRLLQLGSRAIYGSLKSPCARASGSRRPVYRKRGSRHRVSDSLLFGGSTSLVYTAAALHGCFSVRNILAEK